MTKQSFLYELNKLLLDIPYEEREAAIHYYEDYFDDAGMENEQNVMAELVSPSRIASIIKSDLSSYQNIHFNTNTPVELESNKNSNASYGQSYHNSNNTYQQGYHDDYQNNHQPNSFQGNDHTRTVDNHYVFRNISKIILFCFLFIIGLPLIAPVFAIVLSFFIVLFCFLIVGYILIGVGILLIVSGIIAAFSMNLQALILLGAGMILLGLGILFSIMMSFLIKKLFPQMKNFISKLFHKSPKQEGGTIYEENNKTIY